MTAMEAQKTICMGMIRILSLMIAKRKEWNKKDTETFLSLLGGMGDKFVHIVVSESLLLRSVTFQSLYQWYADVYLSHHVWSQMTSMQSKLIAHMLVMANDVFRFVLLHQGGTDDPYYLRWDGCLD